MEHLDQKGLPELILGEPVDSIKSRRGYKSLGVEKLQQPLRYGEQLYVTKLAICRPFDCVHDYKATRPFRTRVVCLAPRTGCIHETFVQFMPTFKTCLKMCVLMALMKAASQSTWITMLFRPQVLEIGDAVPEKLCFYNHYSSREPVTELTKETSQKDI